MGDISIKAADGGSFTGYLARPAAQRAPGLLVIQEIFGVNQVMRGICDRMAEAGFIVLCPDLFWRQEPGIQITDKSDQEWARAIELMQGFNEAKGVSDLIASLEVLTTHEGCTGRAGSMGYCLGGKLAYLMATRSDAHCNVGYYGVGIENALGEASAITKPLLLHIAEEDGFVPKPAQEKIRAVLADHAMVTIHGYPGCDHAFARIGGKNYNAEAAERANARTLDFLRTHLS